MGEVASVCAGAAFAEAGEFNTQRKNAAVCASGGRQLEVVELGGGEIADDSAADADIVMVRLGVGIEVDGLAELAVGGDEVEVVEDPEGAIDGIERDAGQAVADCPVNGFGVGVIEVGCDLAEDLKALVGEFDTGLAGFGFEPFEVALDGA